MNDSNVTSKEFCLFTEIVCTFCLHTQFFILCCVPELQSKHLSFYHSCSNSLCVLEIAENSMILLLFKYLH